MLPNRRRAARVNQPEPTRVRTHAHPLRVGHLNDRTLLCVTALFIVLSALASLCQAQDTAGWWDQMGWRSAEGAGITHDNNSDPGDVQLVLSSDGDPVALWIDRAGVPTRVGDPAEAARIPYHWEVSGDIEAAQFVGGSQGWVDLSSSDQSIGSGTELAIAAGPDGQIVAAWVSENEIVAARWDGKTWTNFDVSSGDAGGVDKSGNRVHEKPDIAISNSGEVFISYAALHPNQNNDRREILVQKFELADVSAAPLELVSKEVGIFGNGQGTIDAQITGGVSNDLARSIDASIAVNADGRPIVVWSSQQSEGNIEVLCKRWDGTRWRQYGVEGAADSNADGLFGVSADEGISIQADLAIAPNKDVIVTWINWANWAQYEANGRAGVYVKRLPLGVGASAWEAYGSSASASGSGIARYHGWHYNPRIDVDSSSKPFITWHTWNFAPTQTGIEYPHEIYASYYFDHDNNLGTADTFDLLQDPCDPCQAGFANPRLAHPAPAFAWARGTFDAFMPYPLIDPCDNLIIAYTWYDIITNGITRGGHQDSEIFLQRWDKVGKTWAQYGRGSDSGGNDTFGWTNSTWDAQIGLLEEDPCNATTNELDTILANGSHVYRYDRDLDTWSTIDPPGGFSIIYDLRGEPEIEYEVAGSPLLAYVDTATGLPYVFQWNGQAVPDPCWALVGGGAADTRTGNIAGETGISVQAGPNGKILIAYVDTDAGGTDRINTRLWDPAVGAWADFGGGVVEIDEVLEAVYYADFDGWNWDNWGEVTDGVYNPALYAAGAVPVPTRTYAGAGMWLFWPGQIATVGGIEVQLDSQYTYFDPKVFVSIDVSAAAAPAYTNLAGAVQGAGVGGSDAFVIKVEIGEPSDTIAGLSPGAVVEGELDYTLELVTPADVIIEADIMLDAQDSANLGLELFLTINGEVQDAAEGGHAALASAAFGGSAAYSHVIVDTSTYGEGLLSSGDTIGFILRNTAVSSLSTTTYSFPADLQSWTGGWSPADQGSISWNANAAGAGNTGILMTLGDGSTDIEVIHTVTAPSNVNGSGNIGVTFDYEVLTKAGLGALDSVKLEAVLGSTTIEITNAFTQGASQPNANTGETITFTNMPSGNHVFKFVATLSNAAQAANGFATVGLDNIAITLPANSVPGKQLMFAGIDNVAVYQKIAGAGAGTSEWEFSGRAAPGNETAGNPLGRLASGAYVSSAVIHSHVAAVGAQTYVIPNNIVTTDQGRAVISFRYSYVGSDPGDEFRVILTETTGPTTYTSGQIEAGTTTSGWTWARLHASDLSPALPSNWDTLDPGLPPDLPAGTYQVSFQLTSNSNIDTDLYLDNIAVLTSNPTNAIQPLAILLPTGQGAGGNERNFAVGLTVESPGVNLYADLALDSVEETRPYDDGRAIVFETLNEFGADWMAGFQGSYFIGHIMEYDLTDGWERYGDPLGKENGIDFLGYSNGEYLTQSPTETFLHSNVSLTTNPLDPLSVAELAAYRFDMPGDELYRLDDAAAGPFAVLWTLLHRTTGEWVDGNADGLNDHFDFHPAIHGAGVAHWLLGNPGTVLDYQVWRWNPFENASWIDMGFTDDTPVTHGQLVSTGGQDVDVAWTERGTDYTFRQGYVNSYSQSDGAWGVLGTRSVQNDQYGGAMILGDMLIRRNGYPLLAGVMVHIWTDSVREFRPADRLPRVKITDTSGPPDDLLLEFVGGPEQVIDETFTIKNENGTDDLIIYDLAFGTGEVGELFTKRNWPDLPLVLEPEASRDFMVRFDPPSDLDFGRYTSVVLLHVNATDDPANQIVRFDTINLFAWIKRGADIDVIPTDLDFGSFAATEKSIAQLIADKEITSLPIEEFQIHNRGNNDGDPADDLIVEKWFFTGNNYLVPGTVGDNQWTRLANDQEVDPCIYAFLTRLDATSGLYEYQPVDIDDSNSFPVKPIVIPVGQILTVRVAFAPELIGVYNEKLYIRSNDSDDPSVTVSLTGQGISGAGLTVTKDSISGPVLLDGEGSIDFGTVLADGMDSPPVSIVLQNTGTSDLTIESVTVTGAMSDAVEITPVLINEVLDTALAKTKVLTLTFNPAEAGELDATLTINNDSPVLGESSYTISLIGLAVAEVEAILTFSADGNDIVSPDGLLDLGEVLVNSASPNTKTIRITNTGGLAAEITSIRFRNDASFNVVPVGNTVLAPLGGFADFTVSFSPSEVGYSQDTLTVDFEYIAQGVTTNGNMSFTAFGDGLEVVILVPKLLVSDDSGNPDDHRVEFDRVFTNEIGQSIAIITLANTGTKDFDSVVVMLSGEDPCAFAIANGAGTLAIGVSRDVIVTFSHATTGVHNAILVITTDPCVADPLIVTLEGEVLAIPPPTPEGLLVVSPGQPGPPPELDFRPTDAGAQELRYLYGGVEQSQKKFVIRNPSETTDLLIRGLHINSTSFQFDKPITRANKSDDVTLTLDPNNDYEVTVTFSPSRYFHANIPLTIYSSTVDGGSETINDPFTVMLAARAVTAERIGDNPELESSTVWSDGMGNSITVKLSGQGTATILGGEDGSNDIDQIIVTDTDSKSVLRVSAPSNADVNIGSISGIAMNQVKHGDNVSIGAPAGGADGVSATIGKDHDKKTIWIDSSSNPVTIKLSGNGTATISGSFGKDIDHITLTGTDARSVLHVSGRSGRSTKVGGISGGNMGQIALKNVTIGAGGIDLEGLAKKLQVGDIADGGDITIDKVLGIGKAISITTGQLGPGSSIIVDAGEVKKAYISQIVGPNSSVSFAGKVRKLTIGQIGANSTITVGDDLRSFRSGQIGADCTITIGGDLRSFRSGLIGDRCVINIAGNATSIRAGDFGLDSQMNVGGDIGKFLVGNFSHGLLTGYNIGKITVKGTSFGGSVEADLDKGVIKSIKAKKATLTGQIKASKLLKYKFANEPDPAKLP